MSASSPTSPVASKGQIADLNLYEQVSSSKTEEVGNTIQSLVHGRLRDVIRASNREKYIMQYVSMTRGTSGDPSSESRSLEKSSSASNVSRQAKIRRSRLACRRCQQRKIKCDEAIPQCSACQKAGVRCEDGRRTGLEESVTRSQAQYIKRLEKALREKAPNVSLESLQVTDAYDAELDDIEASATEIPRVDTRGNVASCADDNEHQRRSGTNVGAVETNANNNGDSGSDNDVAHEIGLVPLSTGANKYVGPSSGLAFAKTIFSRAVRGSTVKTHADLAESPSTTTSRSLLSIKPESLPTSVGHALQLSCIYFEHIHVQHPFLHQPSFLNILSTVYEHEGHSQKWMMFQVRMVLAISAVILARRLPIPYSGEGLYVSAMQDKDDIDFYNSLEGLRCLLLIYMFNLHSPHGNVSSWHLNYQCLAVVLDLGLQRNVPVSTNISPLEREMRTRIFWVVYSIDRTLATTLGRPIGLRDEACDLRLPNGVEDIQLQDPRPLTNFGPEMTTQEGSISCAITLFRLANMNSELKYILHSVNHTTPRYTYPQISNIEEWQYDLRDRLQACFDSAPKYTDARRYLSVICEIRYHEVAMHLFRPTPRIRAPKYSSLLTCTKSAIATILLWKELHKADRLAYSWTMVHSICLSALTILYGIWTSAEIARSTKLDSFITIMRDASVLLGIVGEYWTEARRGRDRLDELVNATTRWLIDNLSTSNRAAVMPTDNIPIGENQHVSDGHTNSVSFYREENQPASATAEGTNINESFSSYVNDDDLYSFLGASNTLFADSEMLMDGLFVDYQPMFDFNSSDVNVSALV